MATVIINAGLEDLQMIYLLFEEAIRFQAGKNYIGWKNYDKEYVKADIQSGLLYKVVREKDVLGIFSICHSDELIWRDKENSDAVYLHRIILNQKFRGEKLFQHVLDWAIRFARENKLKNIRMDTWADNEKIIAYYKSFGFKFIENYTTPDTEDLPLQHRNLKVSLLELCIAQTGEPYASAKIVNISHEFSSFKEYWSQKIIGKVNGQLIKVAKGKGETRWHMHQDQDELFILHKGHLTIQLRDRNIEMYENDMFIVPKGVEHCPKADGEVEFLIMGLSITSDPKGGQPN